METRLGDRQSWEGWGGFRRKILGSERDQGEKGRAEISNFKRIWEGNPHSSYLLHSYSFSWLPWVGFFFLLTLASVSLKPIQLILTLSIWKWHQTPHPSNETVPLPHFSCWSQVQVVTLFLAEWVEIRGTDNALLRSVNFLEWLTELRETFYFLDPQLIRKGCNSGTAR